MSHETRDDFNLPAWTRHLGSLLERESELDESSMTVEFPDGSGSMSLSRRDFLRVASTAAAASGLTAAAGCRVPQDKVVPYVKRPEEVYQGVPNIYTSVCRGCSAGCGTLMTVREGRPQKLEGNPDHPLNRGKLCARGQASVLDLYDASRLQTPVKGDGSAVTWEALDKAVSGAIKGKKVRVLARATSGSAERALWDAFAKGTGAQVIYWEPLAQNALGQAHEKAYGEPFLPHYRFDAAQSIVSFGSEFLDTWMSPTEFTGGYASKRNPDQEINHLTVFEGRLTLTGTAADERHPVKPSDFLYVALAVANEIILGGSSRFANDPNVRAALKGYSADGVAKSVGIGADAIKSAAARLKKAGKAGLAVAGRSGAGVNGVQLEAVVALINEAIGAVGTTVEHRASQQGATTFAPVAALLKELTGGSVDVLIIHGLNPVYDMPPALKFGAAMKGAKTSVVIDTVLTETGKAATYVAAANHDLESWGDSEPVQGTYSLQQPGMMPLFSTRTWADSVIAWAGSGFDADRKANKAYKDPLGRPAPGVWFFFLQRHWSTEIRKKVGGYLSGAHFWEAAARKGILEARSTKAPARTYNTKALEGIAGTRPKDSGGDELELFAAIGTYDGRHHNNGILYELPDPVMRISWDNYIAVSPGRFKQMGLQQGSILRVEANGQSVELPAALMPGLPENVFAMSLAYGRTSAGAVGNGVGQNGFAFAGGDAKTGPVYTGIKVTVTATGKAEELGIPRGLGQVIDQRSRYLVPVTTSSAYKKDKHAGAPRHPEPGMWDVHGPAYEKHGLKWSMAIDLSRCTGCGSCVTACQVENNIPVVGKLGVIEGRLMHWIRIDRYFELPDDKESYDEELLDLHPEVAAAEYLSNPNVLFEPMLCQHCNNAPCETVCPVAATVHSTDGLNEQVYNRCVGTRYCANNCPYKVRRFNWYTFTHDRSEEFIADIFPEVKDHATLNAKWPTPLRFNPEVTVRIRGVMEKCSFCVQRLRKGTVVYKKLGLYEGRPQTACQQTCPAEAMSFGNVLDKKDPVYEPFHDERAFAVIESVGTQPSIRYLTRVRNDSKA